MKVLVTGATGFLGRRVCKKLKNQGIEYIPTSLSLGLDLRNKQAVNALWKQWKPEVILNCAAYVGGIAFGYEHPAEIFSNNLEMTINLFEASKNFQVKRIVNPISNCAYPAKASIFREEEFWDGPLHESVMVYGFVRKASWIGAYAYARQFGMDTINLILSNMYGPEDHFDEKRSHALGALIMKFVKAKRMNEPFVSVWGTGEPVREWLHVDDAAEAMIRAIDIPKHIEPINIGVERGISIAELASLIKKYTGYKGEIEYDISKPDGASFKTVDGSKGQKIFDWSPRIEFEIGVKETIDWYVNHIENQLGWRDN